MYPLHFTMKLNHTLYRHLVFLTLPICEETYFIVSLLYPVTGRCLFFPVYLHILQVTGNNRRISDDTSFIKLGEEDAVLINLTNLICVYYVYKEFPNLPEVHKFHITFITAFLRALESTF
jgi:hypothetical protein